MPGNAAKPYTSTQEVTMVSFIIVFFIQGGLVMKDEEAMTCTTLTPMQEIRSA